jgi:hypothetical protein
MPASPPADLGLGFFRFLPFIVWGVISLVPPQIAVLAWLLWKLFGMSIWYPVHKSPFSDVLGFSALIALSTWPFLILYFVTRWWARRRWPAVGVVKAAMCGSAIAIAIPSLGISLYLPHYMLRTGWNPHEPSSLLLALALFVPFRRCHRMGVGCCCRLHRDALE